MTIKAVYEDGVLKPKTALPLREHEEVEIDVRRAPVNAAQDDPTGWKAMREFIGLAGEGGGSGNASEDHDAIIYRR
jgi:predicted DNA-binding antitoxin AbrB/MazE fold protein